MSTTPATAFHANARALPPSGLDSASGHCWYVAYTRPRQETIAEQNLHAQGFHVYLPLYKTSKKQQATFEPMFPRYIFFRPGRPQQSIATVKSTRGITCLIMFGAEMALLRESTIESIRHHEQQRNTLALDTLTPLRPGRRVRIRNAALDGLEGLIHSVSAKRVTLLLEILGQERMLTVESDHVELAD